MIGLLHPDTINIGGAIMEDDVECETPIGDHEALDGNATLGGGDVFDKGVATVDGAMGKRST